MLRYINCMIHVRHICYLKITFCFTETLMGISMRTSSSASENWISTSASEDVISDTRIRRSTYAYAEAWWTDLRSTLWTLIKTTTVHQHLSSARMSQSQNTLKWQRYCAFKMSYYQRHHSRQDLLNKERMLLALKRNYYSNVPYFQCYINKSMKIELAHALQQSTRLKSNHHLP